MITLPTHIFLTVPKRCVRGWWDTNKSKEAQTFTVNSQVYRAKRGINTHRKGEPDTEEPLQGL